MVPKYNLSENLEKNSICTHWSLRWRGRNRAGAKPIISVNFWMPLKVIRNALFELSLEFLPQLSSLCRQIEFQDKYPIQSKLRGSRLHVKIYLWLLPKVHQAWFDRFLQAPTWPCLWAKHREDPFAREVRQEEVPQTERRNFFFRWEKESYLLRGFFNDFHAFWRSNSENALNFFFR